LNQAIKRNINRFPTDFMFRLTNKEYNTIKDEIDLLNQSMSSQTVMTYPGKRPRSAMPYAFTEQGVAMLSGVLNSDKAIQMNISIMRAFAEVRKLIYRQNDLKGQIEEIKEHLGNHDVQLNQIYDAIENLVDEKVAQRKWNERERIGFMK
jgi:hypothetical protein